MTSPRVRKIADRIQVIVAEMLERRIKDPRLGFVTVTDVRLTGDSQQATVFYTVLGDDDDLVATAAALESAQGPAPLRGRASSSASAHAPSLTFVLDAVPENAAHLDEVLRKARASDEAVAAARQGAAYAGEADPYRKPRADDGARRGPRRPEPGDDER